MAEGGKEEPQQLPNTKLIKRLGDQKRFSMSSLHLPKNLHPRGEENYAIWRTHITNVAEYNNLEIYISVRHQKLKPKFVDFDDLEASEDKFNAWKNWNKGDARMKMAITHNCKSTPVGLVSNCKTALEMWQILQQQYEGSRVVLEYQAITQYTGLKYEDFSSLEAFIIAFRKSIEQLTTRKIQPPEEWHQIMFIAALSASWPKWAKQQRSLAANKDYVMSLEALIADITVEARRMRTSELPR